MWLWDRLAQFQGVKLRAGWRDIKVLCRGSSWKLEQCVEGAVATEAVLAKPWSRVATGGAGSRHLPPAIPPPSEGRGPPKIRPCERGRRRGWRRGRETDRRRDRRRRAPRKLNGERRPPHRRDKTRPEGAPILRSLNGGKTRFYSTPVRSEFASSARHAFGGPEAISERRKGPDTGRCPTPGARLLTGGGMPRCRWPRFASADPLEAPRRRGASDVSLSRESGAESGRLLTSRLRCFPGAAAPP